MKALKLSLKQTTNDRLGDRNMECQFSKKQEIEIFLYVQHLDIYLIIESYPDR